MVMHNQVNYDSRLAFVRKVLHERFRQENITIAPIQYDPECIFKYNNFVYRVSLAAPIAGANQPSQPGCVPIPDGIDEFIMRLTNSDCDGMSAKTRVENEVTMISLAADALSSFIPHIVPQVYGWGTASCGSQGWIFQELMPGTPCSDSFETMTLEQKRQLFAQMASILKALQDYRLPETVREWGGVTLDSAGQAVSGPMVTVGAGPWPSLEASFKSRLEIALEEADANLYIKGWHANGLRERLDAFVNQGLPTQFRALESKDERALVHADFRSDNLMWDATSGRITALIDYDFSCISHPCYEFFRSLDADVGQFQGWREGQEGEEADLQRAKLHGFPSPLPESTQDGVQWEVAKAWEDELIKLDLKRPSTITGIGEIANVDMILGSILPWRLHNSDIVQRQSEDVKLRHRDVKEKELIGLLDRLGF